MTQDEIGNKYFTKMNMHSKDDDVMRKMNMLAEMTDNLDDYYWAEAWEEAYREAWRNKQ